MAPNPIILLYHCSNLGLSALIADVRLMLRGNSVPCAMIMADVANDQRLIVSCCYSNHH